MVIRCSRPVENQLRVGWGGVCICFFRAFSFSFFSFFLVESKQTGGEDDAKVGRAEQLSFKVAEATDGGVCVLQGPDGTAL